MFLIFLLVIIPRWTITWRVQAFVMQGNGLTLLSPNYGHHGVLRLHQRLLARACEASVLRVYRASLHIDNVTFWVIVWVFESYILRCCTILSPSLICWQVHLDIMRHVFVVIKLSQLLSGLDSFNCLNWVIAKHRFFLQCCRSEMLNAFRIWGLHSRVCPSRQKAASVVRIDAYNLIYGSVALAKSLSQVETGHSNQRWVDFGSSTEDHCWGLKVFDLKLAVTDIGRLRRTSFILGLLSRLFSILVLYVRWVVVRALAVWEQNLRIMVLACRTLLLLTVYWLWERGSESWWSKLACLSDVKRLLESLNSIFDKLLSHFLDILLVKGAHGLLVLDSAFCVHLNL